MTIAKGGVVVVVGGVSERGANEILSKMMIKATSMTTSRGHARVKKQARLIPNTEKKNTTLIKRYLFLSTVCIAGVGLTLHARHL